MVDRFCQWLIGIPLIEIYQPLIFFINGMLFDNYVCSAWVYSVFFTGCVNSRNFNMTKSCCWGCKTTVFIHVPVELSTCLKAEIYNNFKMIISSNLYIILWMFTRIILKLKRTVRSNLSPVLLVCYTSIAGLLSISIWEKEEERPYVVTDSAKLYIERDKKHCRSTATRFIYKVKNKRYNVDSLGEVSLFL